MAVYGDNHICSGCYAMINRFNMPNVLRAQWIRFLWLKDCLLTTSGKNQFVETMISAIRDNVTNGYFRIFDSGDFHHYDAVIAWYRICRSLPRVNFWVPTRAYQAKGLKWRLAFALLNSLPNVVVRPSALQYNEVPPALEGFGPGSTVITGSPIKDVPICPKTEFGGNCTTNSCRSCWDRAEPVSYLVHGFNGSHKAPNAHSAQIVLTRDAIKRHITALTVKGQLIEKETLHV